MGLLQMLVTVFELGMLSANVADNGTIDPKEVVINALEETEVLIVSMCANEGQLSVIEGEGLAAFAANTEQALISNNFQWEDVNLGEYMDFVGEIVEVGNQIMQDACDEAIQMQEEIENLIGVDFSEDADSDEADFEE